MNNQKIKKIGIPLFIGLTAFLLINIIWLQQYQQLIVSTDIITCLIVAVFVLFLILFRHKFPGKFEPNVRQKGSIKTAGIIILSIFFVFLITDLIWFKQAGIAMFTFWSMVIVFGLFAYLLPHQLAKLNIRGGFQQSLKQMNKTSEQFFKNFADKEGAK